MTGLTKKVSDTTDDEEGESFQSNQNQVSTMRAPMEGMEQPTDPAMMMGKRRGSKKWLWMSIVALLLVVAAVTAGVVVFNNQNAPKDDASANVELDDSGSNGDTSNNNKGNDGLVSDGSPSFSQSREFMESICGDTGTSDECQAECDGVPECCSLGGAESDCMNNNLEGCAKYAKCHVLDDLVRAAPWELYDICTNPINNDLTACQQACAEASCCYTAGEQCPEDYLLTCIDYAPCQVLNVNNKIPIADSQALNQACLPGGDSQECEELCDAASCCWSTNLLPISLPWMEKNCLQDSWFTCLTYAPCGTLLLPDANTIVPTAPSGLNETCSKDVLIDGSDADREACEDACEKASCCYAGLDAEGGTYDGEANCFPEDPLGCAEYTSCLMLNLTGGVVPPAIDELGDICSWEVINADGGVGLERCRTECAKADCCLSSDPEENCLAKGNAFTCIDYTLPCSILVFAGGAVPEPEENLNEVCSRTAYANEPQACVDACTEAACCFDDDLEANCLAANLDTCGKYTLGGCLRPIFNPIEGDDTEDEQEDETEDGNDETPPSETLDGPTFTQTRAFMNNVCGEGASEACQAECEGVPECCSLGGAGNSECLNSHLEDCTNYATCHVMQDLVPAAPWDLYGMCVNPVGNDLTACRAACAEASCCYTKGEQCPENYFMTCIDYAPCQVLNEENDVSVADSQALNEACLLSGDRQQCEELCDAASCCWSKNLIPIDLPFMETNCLQDSWFSCLTYAPCGMLLLPEANEVVPAAPAGLNETCSREALVGGTDADRQACEEECEKGGCCFSGISADGYDGDMNCFPQDPFGCAEYTPCMMLNLTGGIVPPAVEDLPELCSWEAINAEGDIAVDRCRAECEKADCCFSGFEDNCLADGNIFTCFNYTLPCSILILVGGDVPDPPENLREVCSRASYQDNPEECKLACAEASCCYDNDLAANCIVDNLDTCGKYTLGGCLRPIFNPDP